MKIFFFFEAFKRLITEKVFLNFFLKFYSGRRFDRHGYHHRDKLSKIYANNLKFFNFLVSL